MKLRNECFSNLMIILEQDRVAMEEVLRVVIDAGKVCAFIYLGIASVSSYVTYRN